MPLLRNAIGDRYRSKTFSALHDLQVITFTVLDVDGLCAVPVQRQRSIVCRLGIDQCDMWWMLFRGYQGQMDVGKFQQRPGLILVFEFAGETAGIPVNGAVDIADWDGNVVQTLELITVHGY